MKKFFTILLIIPLILLCGFIKKSHKPYIILSSGTINTHTTRIERNFASGQRINYALIVPDGLKRADVRLQISQQDTKTTNWGFSIIQTQDLYLVKGDTTFTDYIYLNGSGKYILQFFYLNNKDYPFAHVEFMVQ